MASVNKVILLGNLGKDVELRFTASGIPVASFTMATSESYKDKDGQKKEKTEWHTVVAWNKLAELCSEYLAKGKPVYIEGKLQTRKWQDKDGKDRYTTEIVAERMQLLAAKEGSRPPKHDDADAPSGYGGGATYDEPVFNPSDEIPF